MKILKNEFSEYLLYNNIDLELLDKYYTEPHRYYHNWSHIESMLIEARDSNALSNDLFLAIIYHDVIYNPKSSDNELESAKLFRELHGNNEDVYNAILDTKIHVANSELSKLLCKLDLNILNADITEFVKFENKIFKEYQFVDYKIYKEKRIEILSSLGVSDEKLNYVRYRKPNIALYSGSFNPFHRGHLNILEKAEAIFDKVIVARGINNEKVASTYNIPNAITNRQIETYDGLVTDFIDSLGYDVTLIRGLRNTTDLQYELNQYRYLQELKPDIKVVSIFCDAAHEHISSSGIRSLDKYNVDGRCDGILRMYNL